MDLKLAGRRAIVCGASMGLGHGCAWHLADNGVAVWIAGRTEAPLLAAAQRMAEEIGAQVTPVVADVTTPAGRETLLAACPDPDILVTNAAGPPPGSFRDWGREDWIRALDNNMLSPIALIQATLDGMIARRWGRVVNITSSAVKAPIPTIGLSNGARAGLTGFIAGLAREVAQHGVTINNLLPGSFETRRLQQTQAMVAQARGVSLDQVMADGRAENPTRRFGDPMEFGAACAFLCSQWAGYVTGQNWVLDGGAFPGTL